MVGVAKAADLPGATDLHLPASTSIKEAWATVSASCRIGEDDLARLVADFFRVEVAELTAADPSAARLLPGPLARRLGVVPLEDRDRRLAVATADPSDVAAEQQIGFASGRSPVFCVAPPDHLKRAIEIAYPLPRTTSSTPSGLDASLDPRLKILAAEPRPDEAGAAGEEGIDEGPIINLTNMILEDAVSKAASDIHLQPLPGGGVIRLRVDGVLRSGLKVPLPVLGRVISRIKIMSRLDISDKMRPQDGRTHVRIEDRKFDLRISTVPVRGGEKAVIRILDPLNSGALDESGLPAREVERLRRVLRSRDGILVVTGPTGSGKTTTMYGALREIATEDVNIMTVEDPVEYELPGLTQIQVDAKQGVTFQSALKAILRQDPDVIFVGEIRDTPTAETAAQASLTGHLVLATVHANDAVGSVRRFLDLGLDAGTIAETLRGALAQRLLRTLCTDCARPVEDVPDRAETELAERYGVQPTMRAVGCEECGNSGYRGRRPVVELIVPTPELLRLVSAESTHVDMVTQARLDGMRSMLEGALDLVSEGLTTLTEVERVIGEESSAQKVRRVAQDVPDLAPAASAPPTVPPTRYPEPAAPAAPLPAAASQSAVPLPAPDSAAPSPSAVPLPAPDSAAPSPSAEHLPAPDSAAPLPKPDTSAATLSAEPAEHTIAPSSELPNLDDVEGEPRVLLVEDDADTRLLCRSLLESRTWRVDEAPDGATAFLQIGRDPGWSLVVLDLGLPDIDGLVMLSIL